MLRGTRRLLTAVLLVAAGTLVALPAAPPAAAASIPPPGPITAPPMGWNSWNRFGCNIDENLIRTTADAIVANGLDATGYRYVNIDDCWMASTRDAQGRLRSDPTRFPSGIAALATYVHGKGLKLGIYSSAGTATCQGLPASLDHETIDADTIEPFLPGDFAVELRNISFRYSAGRPLLFENFSLAIDPNSRVGIIGRSGAGKTTLFNVLTGRLRPSEGCVRIGARDVTRMGAHRRVHTAQQSDERRLVQPNGRMLVVVVSGVENNFRRQAASRLLFSHTSPFSIRPNEVWIMATRAETSNTPFWVTMAIIAAGAAMLIGWFTGVPW